jgi:hypothetical protein
VTDRHDTIAIMSDGEVRSSRRPSGELRRTGFGVVSGPQSRSCTTMSVETIVIVVVLVLIVLFVLGFLGRGRLRG